jgi:hypothetical protein
VLGKRKIRVVKSMVEYVMCPDIFQKNVMSVMTVDTKKRFRDTFVTISIFRVVTSRKNIPKSMVMVVKYGGLSSLLVNS